MRIVATISLIFLSFLRGRETKLRGGGQIFSLVYSLEKHGQVKGSQIFLNCECDFFNCFFIVFDGLL